jgi:hypothetical protein
VKEWVKGLSENQRNVFLAACYIAFALLFGTFEGFIAGSIKPSRFIPFLTLPIGIWIFQKFQRADGNSEPTRVRIPELEHLLETEGGSSPEIYLLNAPGNRDYPTQLVGRYWVSISEERLNTLSAPALAWQIRTELRAEQRFSARTNRVIAWFLVCILVGFPLGERFKISAWWLMVPVLLVCAFVPYVFRVQSQENARADKKTTVSEEDRLAAKEALSYTYFALSRQKQANTWPESAKHYSERAERLGIVLEEGYRIPGAEGIRVGE